MGKRASRIAGSVSLILLMGAGSYIMLSAPHSPTAATPHEIIAHRASVTAGGKAGVRRQTSIVVPPSRGDQDTLRALHETRPIAHSVTWLLLGSDSRQGQVGRSDAMLLAHLSRSGKLALLVSIPRDMRVWVDGYGYTKVNHALAYGGLPLVRSTVERALGVPFDHVLAIDFTAFSQLIDALGGVDLKVPQRLDYDDLSDGTHIHIRAGWQHLNGAQALGFVRFRHDVWADTGRMQRQQALLSAIATTHVPVSRWWTVAQTVAHMPHHIHTDASVLDVMSQMAQLTLKLPITLKVGTLQGTNRVDPKDQLWYFYVNARDVLRLRQQMAAVDRIQ